MKWTIAPIIVLATSVILACSLAPALGTPPPAEPTAVPSAVPTAAQPCLESGDQNLINSRLQGPGAVAILCPGALFELTGPVIISADRQQIYT